VKEGNNDLISLDDIPDDEQTYMSYSDIYKELLTNEELILVIERGAEQVLRRRLTVLKAKDIAKMKDAGLAAEDSKLEFIIIEDEDIPKSLIKLQIVLKARPRIRVYSMAVPDGSLT